MTALEPSTGTDLWSRLDATTASWLLGVSNEAQLTGAATETLSALIARMGGCDSAALWRLAGGGFSDCGQTLVELHNVYRERGLQLPLSGEALEIATDRLLIEMLAGESSPEETAAHLWSLADTDVDLRYDLLQVFKGMAIGREIIEDFSAKGPEHGGEVVRWREELLDVVRAVLARGGLSTELVFGDDRIYTLAEIDAMEETEDGA